MGLRHVTPAQRAAVFAALNARSPRARTTRAPCRYEDVARALDEHALAYGSLKAMEAVQRARWELGAVRPMEEVEEAGEEGKAPTKVRRPKELPEFELRLPTPWGTVLFDNSGNNTHRPDAPFLVVRTWAENNWSGGLANTAPNRPLSLALAA